MLVLCPWEQIYELKGSQDRRVSDSNAIIQVNIKYEMNHASSGFMNTLDYFWIIYEFTDKLHLEVIFY